MIHVYMLEGRTRDQKRRIIEGMTNAMVDVCGSKVERVGVIIHELSADNWGRDGAPMGTRSKQRTAQSGAIQG